MGIILGGIAGALGREQPTAEGFAWGVLAGSFLEGRPVSTPPASTIADGLACRVPNPTAVATICAGAERVVTVSDAAIRAAMRHYFTDTHNVVEGAGAAPLAALLDERETMQGRKVAVIASGGNVDADVFARVLMER